MSTDSTQTISIPSLLLLLVLTALTVRYFFFSKSSSSSSTSSRGNNRGANSADVEQIAQMFPQLGRREIMWDLQRNGGSVAATTERVLGVGRLETPPLSFQPPIPPPTTPSTTANSSAAQPKQEHLDLIKRYNLSGKVAALEEGGSSSGAQGEKTWSNNREERQAMFQRRREEMVLNARRKLEEKERGKRAGGA